MSAKRATDPPNLRRNLLRLAIAVAVAVVLVGLKMAFIGLPKGATCERDSDCKGLFGTMCLFTGGQRYCTKRCRTDAECGAGWSCGLTHWINVRTGERRGDVRTCVQTSPPVAPDP